MTASEPSLSGTSLGIGAAHFLWFALRRNPRTPGKLKEKARLHRISVGDQRSELIAAVKVRGLCGLVPDTRGGCPPRRSARGHVVPGRLKNVLHPSFDSARGLPQLP